MIKLKFWFTKPIARAYKEQDIVSFEFFLDGQSFEVVLFDTSSLAHVNDYAAFKKMQLFYTEEEPYLGEKLGVLVREDMPYHEKDKIWSLVVETYAFYSSYSGNKLWIDDCVWIPHFGYTVSPELMPYAPHVLYSSQNSALYICCEYRRESQRFEIQKLLLGQGFCQFVADSSFHGEDGKDKPFPKNIICGVHIIDEDPYRCHHYFDLDTDLHLTAKYFAEIVNL